jgi:uncharacterized protein YdeI (YjbR/CyaY-like superfamily)
MDMQKNTPWNDELVKIRSILAQVPLEIEVKWGANIYTYKGQNVISYGGFKHHFAIWFYKGVFLTDPYNVLVNASEGVTKSMRQWRFTSADQIDEKKILAYVYEAIEVEKSGLQIKPEKFQPLPIPTLLAEKFLGDKDFEISFKSLSPGKQKEYITYLNQPKQEATKYTRLEKIIPMVMLGKGLNDKYK